MWFADGTRVPLIVPLELIEGALSTSLHLAGQDVSLNMLRPPPSKSKSNTNYTKRSRNRGGRDRSSSSSSIASSNASRENNHNKTSRRRRSRSRSSSSSSSKHKERRSKSRGNSESRRHRKKKEQLKDTALPPLFLSPIITEERKSTEATRRHSGTSAPSPTHKAFRRRTALPKISRPWSAPQQNDVLLSSSSPRPGSSRSSQSEPLPSPPILQHYARGSPHMWILERKRMRSISSENFVSDKPRTSSNESCNSSIYSSFDEAVALGFDSKGSSSPIESLATSLSQILSDDNLMSPPSFLPQPSLVRTKSNPSRRASLPPMAPRVRKKN